MSTPSSNKTLLTPSAESSNGANVGAIASGSIAGCILCIILIGLILNGDPNMYLHFY